MKKIIGLTLLCVMLTAFVFAETIILKSGKEIDGKILEKTDDYITVDFHEVPVTYFLDEIEQITAKDEAISSPEQNITEKESTPLSKLEQIINKGLTPDQIESIKNSLLAQFKEVRPALSATIHIISFLASLLTIIAIWKIFSKAGHPGWMSLIPIYNLHILLKIIDKPQWWILLFFIPFVNIIIYLILNRDIAKYFDKSPGFGIGLSFLPFIFFPILAFSKEKKPEIEEPSYRP